MRRLSSVLLASVLAVPTVVVLPTLPTATARPRPVQTRISTMPLAGLELAAAAGYEPRLRFVAERGLSVLTNLRRTWPFQTVGVTWRMPVGLPSVLDVQVRTRTDHVWSGWQQLDTDVAGQVDPSGGGQQRAGTAPMWVGPSDGVQVKVALVSGPPAQDMRVELVDPGTSDYDAEVGSRPAGTASAVAGRPAILPRAAWGADEARVRSAPDYVSTIKAGVLHHTADRNGYSPAQVPAILRADYAYHLSRGWNDVGYNFLVDRFGRIWEGRAGGVALAVQGAHSGGFNTDTFGVSMIGNYQQVRPTATALTAVARLFAWKLDLYHRDPFGSTLLTSAGGGTSRYPVGSVVRKPVLMGHRDVGQTDCPGRFVYRLLPAMRRTVAALMKAALLDPAGPAGQVAAGAGAAIRARALVNQSWRLDVRRACTNVRVATVGGRSAARQSVLATWSGRGPGRVVSRPGRYGLTLFSSSARGPARPVTGSVLVLPPAPAAPVSGSVTPAAGRFVAVPPARLLDTRTAGRQPLGPAGRVDLPVLGHGGVPSVGVTAVALSVGAVCAADVTQVSGWPAGAPALAAPMLTVPAAGTLQTLTVLPVGLGGAVSLGNRTGVVDLVVDVVGYYTSGSGSGLRASAPIRVYDSGAAPSGWLQPGHPHPVTLPAIAGLSPGAITGVLAQVTVYRPARAGTLTVQPDAGTDPGTTSMIFTAGRVTQVLTQSGVTSGRVALRIRGGAARVLVDVVGVYGAGGAEYTPLAATRLLDTRSGPALAAGVPRTARVAGVAGVPADATAVLLMATTVNPDSDLAVTAWPAGTARPALATLQAPGRQTRTSPVLVPVGAGSAISVQSGARTDLVLDVVGYYR